MSVEFLTVIVLVVLGLAAASVVNARAQRRAQARAAPPMFTPPDPTPPPRLYAIEHGIVEVDVADLVVDALDRFVEMAQLKRIELVVLVDDTVPQILWGHTGPVHRLLVNFIRNAIAVTRRGKVTVIATGVDGTEENSVVRFSVSDNGYGVSRDDALTFFEPIDDAGFGWTESCAVIDELGGSRGVMSRAGVGSTVWFTVPFQTHPAAVVVAAPELFRALGALPFAEIADEPFAEVVLKPAVEPASNPVVAVAAEPEPAAAEPVAAGPEPVASEPEPVAAQPEPEPVAAEPEPEPEPERRGSLLVADDDPVNRRLAVVMLQRTGYQVEAVTDGEEAVLALANRQFDAVVMDCRMPRLDGFEATRRIRAAEGQYRHTPIIALTAAATEADRASAMAAGMDDYLVKPVEPQHLLDTVDRWVPTAEAAGAGSGRDRH